MDIAGEFSWEIKAHVAAALCVYVSDDQLKYWREREAVRIVSDVQHPAGRGRTTLYVPGTARRVVQLIQLLADHRNLNHAVLELANDGNAVDQKSVRENLLHAAQAWDDSLAVIREKAFVGTEHAAFSDLILSWLDTSPRFHNRSLPLVRKLVRSKRLESFIFHMLRLAMGYALPKQPSWTDPNREDVSSIAEEHDVVVTGLGFNRLKIDRVRGVKPMTNCEIVAVLNKVAGRLRSQSLVAAVTSAPDETLLQATREVEAVIFNNKLIFQALFWVFGRHAFGRGHAARIFDSYDDKTVAMITALWVVVRVAFVSEAAEQVRLQEQGAAAQLLVTSQKLEAGYSRRPGQVRELHKKLTARSGTGPV